MICSFILLKCFIRPRPIRVQNMDPESTYNPESLIHRPCKSCLRRTYAGFIKNNLKFWVFSSQIWCPKSRINPNKSVVDPIVSYPLSTNRVQIQSESNFFEKIPASIRPDQLGPDWIWIESALRHFQEKYCIKSTICRDLVARIEIVLRTPSSWMQLIFFVQDCNLPRAQKHMIFSLQNLRLSQRSLRLTTGSTVLLELDGLLPILVVIMKYLFL